MSSCLLDEWRTYFFCICCILKQIWRSNSQPISHKSIMNKGFWKLKTAEEKVSAWWNFFRCRPVDISLVHHDLRRLVEAHVPVADEPLGVRGQGLVVPARLQKVDPLVGEPPGDVRGRRHLGDVVPVDFAWKKRGFIFTQRNVSRLMWQFFGQANVSFNRFVPSYQRRPKCRNLGHPSVVPSIQGSQRSRNRPESRSRT